MELQDILPPTAVFALLSGSPSARFERVGAGATARHSYSLTPKAGGVYRGVPATVTYKPDSPTSTDQQVCQPGPDHFAVPTLHCRPVVHAQRE